MEHAARLARRPTLTAPARADSSEVRIGTKKRALQIEQRNWRRKKCGALPNLLDKKAPYKGLGADSEEKHEPVSDIDTAVVDSLKVLDPNRPIREADIATFDALLLFEVPKNRRQGPATSGACAPRAALCEWGCLG